MMTLTIAIPAYNAEKFLDKCITSLLFPTFMHRLEILVVDDDSKDSTADIARKYEEQSNGIVRFIKKENGGHGSVINVASAQARGRYFKVLDADDWVVTENMPALLDYLDTTDTDVVIANYDMVDMQGRFCHPFCTQGVDFQRVYTIAEWMGTSKQTRACSTFHGLFYKTDFYRETGIRLSEKVFYEDQEYATLPFYYAETVSFIDLDIYQYLVGREGQSVSHANQVRLLSQIEYILWSVTDFYMSHNDMPEEKRGYFMFKMGGIVLSYYVAALLKNPDRKQGRKDAALLREKLRNKCPELFESTEKKYRIAKALHAIHMTPDGLEQLKRTKIYHVLKKFI